MNPNPTLLPRTYRMNALLAAVFATLLTLAAIDHLAATPSPAPQLVQANTAAPA